MRRPIAPIASVASVGPHTAGDVTPLFSLRENAIAKEPGLRYPERWPCVSRLGCSNGGSASFEASP